MLSAEERAIIGGHSKRITLPMGDALTLRLCAEHFNVLLNNINVLTRLVGTGEFTEVRVMSMLASEIDCLNDKIRKTAKQAGIEIETGRKKGRKSTEHLPDEEGTVIVTGFTPTQVLEEHRRRR